MATPVDPDFRARLAALNEKFAVTVPVTMEKIAAALAVCQAETGPPPAEAMRPLHELLHGVAGSAATFGFATLGREARRIEHMLRDAMDTGSGWDAVAPEVEKYLRWAACDPHATNYD
ncbi:MAG TPA: Hpt domain-containing protein [Duganella sp.]|uniref:Hpt domain-containing protein n=1 Tax=Duganella sp. TaxID=1904440 RepID=UPI002ED3DB1C